MAWPLMARAMGASAESILQNCESCIKIHDIEIRVVPVPVTVPLSVPGLFGSKFSSSSVLYGSKIT